MDQHLVKLSRFLSLVLRHQPEVIGLALDEAGWVDVDELLAKCNAVGRALHRETLQRVVRDNDKQRFAFSDDGLRIRASQGHSVAVDLQLENKVPPAVLYHGTADRFLASILQQGLQPRQRQHVHLSADVETATKVGARHGHAVVLTVAAGVMHGLGHTFHLSQNGVWLCAAVPPQFLVRHQDRPQQA